MASRNPGFSRPIFPLVILTLLASAILISAPAGSQLPSPGSAENAPAAPAPAAAGES